MNNEKYGKSIEAAKSSMREILKELSKEELLEMLIGVLGTFACTLESEASPKDTKIIALIAMKKHCSMAFLLALRTERASRRSFEEEPNSTMLV